MIKRIHILGASGSGTTTLGEELSKEIDYSHFDTDDYFWIKTDPPYTTKRPVEERIDLISKDIKNSDRWILTGSLCGWGDIFIPYFDLVIYLRIPKEIRMKRLLEREKMRYGKKIEEGNVMYVAHGEFMDWASKYDDGDLDIRSKSSHYKWLKNLNCKVLRIEENIELEDKIKIVRETIDL
ncbi:AAA family ATPase [Fusibacter ferrireducens]|uniref:AAA family ATPase n=1 Tax=Fusibacter ferrireducens TaxID=2785058 RepID=A0ABR9ZM59_9FIRM|nr:AAA family ATPase [Fusibacter ferrireducens]MBF4691511.1 AAA family ATPase [Fusibacter ferrireducens]